MSDSTTTPASSSGPNSGPSRQQVLPYGIVGNGLIEVARPVPIDEPPPLAENAKLRSIGKPARRLDAVQKVTGKAQYTFTNAVPRVAPPGWSRASSRSSR